MKKTTFGRRIGIFVMALALAGGAVAQEAQQNSLTNFCNAVARTVYALAWPSATYRTWEFRKVETSAEEIDLTIRLYGQSAFDDSDLWTDVTFDIDDGQMRNVYWGRNNAILMPPGATLTAAKDVMIDLERRYAQSQGSEN